MDDVLLNRIRLIALDVGPAGATLRCRSVLRMDRAQGSEIGARVVTLTVAWATSAAVVGGSSLASVETLIDVLHWSPDNAGRWIQQTGGVLPENEDPTSAQLGLWSPDQLRTHSRIPLVTNGGGNDARREDVADPPDELRAVPVPVREVLRAALVIAALHRSL
jgi:hypothetical protein